MENASALIQHDPRLFLFKALGEFAEQEDISVERFNEINQQIVAIVNKLSIIKPVDISKLSELRGVARVAILRLNLGLEHSSQLDLSRAVRLLMHNDMIRFYQIGNTLMVKLKHDSQDIQQRARLTVSESGMVQMESHPETVMEMCLLSQLEVDFLLRLVNEILIIGEVSIIIESLQKEGQSIEQLSQFEIADRMLKNLSYRLDYLETLPFYLMAKEKDFRYARNLEKSIDLAGKISCGIMVNLVIDSKKHFCVTRADVDQFREKCVGLDGVLEGTEEMLLKWLIEYLETHEVKEAVIDYAYDYWSYWIERLGEFLQRPIESQKKLHDWFIL